MNRELLERARAVESRFDEIGVRLLEEFPQRTDYIKLQATLGGTEIALSGYAREVVCCDLEDFLSASRPSNLVFNRLKLDSEPLTLPDGHFDACLCVEVLEHLRWSTLPLLKWMHRNCDLTVVSSPDNDEWPARSERGLDYDGAF